MVPHAINIVDMIGNAGLMVQFVLLLLLFFSITSWSIILIKYRYIRRAFKESAHFTEFFWQSRDLSAAFAKAKQLPGSPIANVFQIGYVELRHLRQSGPATGAGSETLINGFKGMDNVKRALRRSINEETT